MPETPNQQPVIQTFTVQQVKEMMKEMIVALKEPSDEEKDKKAKEVERRKEEIRQSVLFAEQDLENRMGLHQRCNHHNGRIHTFVAQNFGNGNTGAICQQCLKDYRWRTTADQMTQGVNLLEMPGLTEAHLLAWEKQYPAVGCVPDRAKLLTRAGKPAA